jgi:hypothetical protein
MAQFMSLSNIAEFADSYENQIGSIIPVLTIEDYYIKAIVSFLSDGNSHVVNRITFDIGPYERFIDPAFLTGYGYSPLYEFASFGQISAFYMLPSVLSKLGPPESVHILTFGKSGMEGMQYTDFDLLLMYPDQGILIDYNTKKRIAGKNVLGCMANALVEMELSPLGDRDAFFNRLIKTKYENYQENYKPLEELTSMSVGEFYRIYRKSTDQCLPIPIDKLPVWYP